MDTDLVVVTAVDTAGSHLAYRSALRTLCLAERKRLLSRRSVDQASCMTCQSMRRRISWELRLFRRATKSFARAA